MIYEEIPILPDYPYLTERMTDEETNLFDNGVFHYIAGDESTSDYYIAQINRFLWKPIRKYLMDIDKYYENGGVIDAE